MNLAVAFASLSGNTLDVATNLQTHLLQQANRVALYDVIETPADRLKKYDLVFFGCSTYDDGDLNPIAEMFLNTAHQEMHGCNHTKFAIFSLGDSSYPRFATGGQKLSENLTKMEATIISPIFTIDGVPNEETYIKIKDWSDKIIASLKD